MFHPDLISFFTGVYYAMLTVFVIGTTLLVLKSWVNTRRLRNVLMSWNAVSTSRWPLFPSVFLGIAAVAILANMVIGFHSWHVQELVYLWMGLSWFAACRMMDITYITAHGIVKNINDPSQTVAWHHVNDYMELEETQGTSFTFFFATRKKAALKAQRVRIHVPDSQKAAFQKILRYKVDRQLTHTYFATSDLEHLS